MDPLKKVLFLKTVRRLITDGIKNDKFVTYQFFFVHGYQDFYLKITKRKDGKMSASDYGTTIFTDKWQIERFMLQLEKRLNEHNFTLFKIEKTVREMVEFEEIQSELKEKKT